MMLEGEHTVMLTLRQKTFEIILEDRYSIKMEYVDVSDLGVLEKEVLEKVDGIVFMFSYEIENSF